ncbi:uncharacterized protein C20orf204 homolog [Tupaia chinensis]|uniref:uncharacterized protein C20orf204 homolog n=1 Tax=Tupaia chinensis TaxID=246437 RepID=UPI0003C907DC|nr:uncharacterized protein C20orf204 homolog [Tupaia chinensis]
MVTPLHAGSDPGGCVWGEAGVPCGTAPLLGPRAPVPTLSWCPLQVPLKPTLWALLLALLGTEPIDTWPRACNVPDVLRHYRAVIFEDLQAAVRRAGGAAAEGPWAGPEHHSVQKNLTGAGGPRPQGRPGGSCDAQKEHGILQSIASLGRTLLWAGAEGRRGVLEKAARTVALRIEAVMRRHCPTWRQMWDPESAGPGRPLPTQGRCTSPPDPLQVSCVGRARGTVRTRGLPGPLQRRSQPKTRPARVRRGRRRLLLRALDAVATCWEKLFALRAAAATGAPSPAWRRA